MGVCEGEADSVELGVTVAEGDDDPVALPLPLGVAPADGLAVGAIVVLTLGDCVSVRVGDCDVVETTDAEPDELRVTDNEEEVVPDAVLVTLGVSVLDSDCEGDRDDVPLKVGVAEPE